MVLISTDKLDLAFLWIHRNGVIEMLNYILGNNIPIFASFFFFLEEKKHSRASSKMYSAVFEYRI